MAIPSTETIPDEVDVIVVGGPSLVRKKLIPGGAAGCVIAGRLAKADPKLQILLIEAGPNNLHNKDITTPGFHPFLLNPAKKYAEFYVSTNESPFAGNRKVVIPQAAVLGGGSSINLMMYTRGSKTDYDDWGMEGWTFNDLYPLFKKVFLSACGG